MPADKRKEFGEGVAVWGCEEDGRSELSSWRLVPQIGQKSPQAGRAGCRAADGHVIDAPFSRHLTNRSSLSKDSFRSTTDSPPGDKHMIINVFQIWSP